MPRKKKSFVVPVEVTYEGSVVVEAYDAEEAVSSDVVHRALPAVEGHDMSITDWRAKGPAQENE